MIRSRVYPSINLVIHTPEGELVLDEIIETAGAMYQLDAPPLFSMWDMLNASMSELTLTRLRSFQSAAVPMVRERTGGKTAMVATSENVFATLRQYSALVESFNLPFEHRVFKDFEVAWEWLGIDPLQVGKTAGVDLKTTNQTKGDPNAD